MDEHLYIIEKTKRTDGTERFEIHLGASIYVVSLSGGDKIARRILSLLGIEVTQLETALEKRLKQEYMNEEHRLGGSGRTYKEFKRAAIEDGEYYQ